jgi:hypothetical protein
MKQKLLISFSGGRTSAFMTWWLLNVWPDRHNWDIIVVFANTGRERSETLNFIKQCSVYFNFNCVWVEAITNPEHGKGTRAKIVDYTTASRNGEPFEAMIAKHGIPSIGSPHCTREMKKNTIYAYARSIGWKRYWTAIGIRVDEIDRVAADAEKKRFLYPLVSNGTRKIDVNKFWSKQPFDLQLKSYEGNCDLCFKKSLRKLMTIVNETQWTVDWWKEMEEKYSYFIPESKRHNKSIIPPLHSFRSNKSILDIVNMAKNDFSPAVDDSKYKPEYEQADLWGIPLDQANGCSESCEVF